MKRLIIGLGFALVTILLAPLAQAQSGKSGSTSSSHSGSTSHSGSASSAKGGTGGSVTVEQNYYTDGGLATNAKSATGASNSSGGGGGGSGSNSATIHNTPDVQPPGQFGGTNPCAVGVSGGVSVAGLGIGGGGTWGAEGCERRNSAVILFQAGMPEVAIALLCQDGEIREAFREAGKPCPADRPKPAVADAGQAGAPPQPAAMQQDPPPSAPDSKPAWCGAPVRTEADRATYNYYCRELSSGQGAPGPQASANVKAQALSR